MKSKKINKLKEKKTKKTKQKKEKEEEIKEVEEKEKPEKRKKEEGKAEKAAVSEPVFDFQLQTVIEAAPTTPTTPAIPVPKTKEEAKTKEFNLEDFLQGIKDEKEKKYVSKQDYVARYVQDQEERKYTNATREWREAMIAESEHVKELFPKPSRRVKLRQEFEAQPPAKEMETTISAQERLEYNYKAPFEKKIEREGKRIKKYEIIIS